MAAIQTPGLNPSVLVAPDYQTEMLAAQRRLDLANALQQQALTDTPGNGGSVSWTQGLARIMDALAAKRSGSQALNQMKGANLDYAAGLARMFGMSPQIGQGTPTDASGGPSPADAQNAPSAAPAQPQTPFIPGAPVPPGQPDPLAPVAPPQAASPQPPSVPPQSGGASPMSLTGDPRRDMMLYMMNPQAYTEQLATVAGKGATPTDLEIAVNHARTALQNGDVATAQALLGNVEKQNYIAPVSGRPGGWTIFPDGRREYNPTAPAPGAMPVMDASSQPTGRWTEDPSVAGIQAAQAGAVAGAQAGAKAPYDITQIWDPNKNAFVTVPKSAITGGFGSTNGGSLNTYYKGQSGGIQSSPALGAQQAANTYGAGSANAFLGTQDIAESSPQRVQALREMQSLISGPNALTTGPTAAKLQQLAEEHGLPFGYSNNAFVFNKDAARFIAQNASDLGLNGSDARLGMMAHASPNMSMTPQALKVVIPTMIGLEYAKMAKATAAATWAQHSPQTNAQFESTWRQNYDPRMFTAYAEGGPAALAKAPANLRAQWLRDYRALKGMGVDFTQFAQ